MARDNTGTPPESVISIIGPAMKVVGDCQTDGTVRVEGTVEGSIRAGKAVVIGKGGSVTGDISTQDAVISGRVKGKLVADLLLLPLLRVQPPRSRRPRQDRLLCANCLS